MPSEFEKQVSKWAVQRYGDIEGAPFKRFQKVRVLPTIDDATADPALVGLEGYVDYFEYSCGCGQTYPGDPMIGVCLDNEYGVAEFWKEELEAIL